MCEGECDTHVIYVSLVPLKTALNGTVPGGTIDINVGERIDSTFPSFTCSGVPIGGSKECFISAESSGTVRMEHLADTKYKITFSMRYIRWGALNYARVTYNGDSIYNGSDSPYNTSDMYWVHTSTTISKALQLSNGKKYIEFSTGFISPNQMHYYPMGKYELLSSNGKSCSFDLYNSTGGYIHNNTCGPVSQYFASDHSSTFTVKGSDFDEFEASSVTVIFKGSSDASLHGSVSGPETFSSADTVLGISEIKNTNVGKVNMTMSLTYVDNSFIDHYWPGGSVQISKGSYTCTIPLSFEKISPYNWDLADASSDCGGGTANIRSQAEGYGSSAQTRLIIQVTDLPVTDQTTTTYNAVYSGDWYNKPSQAEGTNANRVSSITEGIFSLSGSNPKIITTVRTTESGTTGFPTRNVTYQFNNSGRHCTAQITLTDASKPNVDYDRGDCDILHVSFSETDFTQSRSVFELVFNSIDPEDTMVTISYEGDSQYKPSSTELRVTRYGVTITPETSNIYTDGRLYFNTQDANVSYPLYPERYGTNAASYCAANPGSSECHILKQSFPLTVRVEPESSAVDMTGETITFTEDVSASCTLSKVSDGVFRCTAENVRFNPNTPGPKTVKAEYDGNPALLLEEASVNFPEMFAVSISGSQAPSGTVITEPALIQSGTTVTVKAKAVESGNTDTEVTDPAYFVIYSYNRDGNHRIHTCYSNECELEITSDVTSVVAEFLGTDQLAPSSAIKNVAAAGASVSFTVGNIEPLGGGN